jgi:PAS domain S-box-containing protein
VASRRVETKELAKLLREQKERVVQGAVADILKIPSFRKKVPISSLEEFSTAAAAIYETLLPCLCQKPDARLKSACLRRTQKNYLERFSLHELQRAQLILLDHLLTVVRKHYSKKPLKLGHFSSLVTHNVHKLILESAISEEKRRKRVQGRLENKYASLLDTANDAIVLVDFESGLFVEANKAACELSGYTEADLRQTGLNSLVSVFDLNMALEKLNATVEQGAVRFDDLSIFTKKGKSIPVDVSASAVVLNGKKHILAIIRDIKERKKFEQEIQQKAMRLQLLCEIAGAISSADLDIEAVLTSILKSIARVIKVEAGSILRLQGNDLFFLAALGEKAELVKPFHLRLGQGIAGWVAEQGKSLIVRDAHSDPRYFPLIEKSTGFITRSILAVPMKVGEEVVGVIELINKVGGAFNGKDLALMEVISNFAAVSLRHATLFNECQTARVRLSQLCSPVSSSNLAAVVAQEMKDPLGIVKNYIRILEGKLDSAGVERKELAIIAEEMDRITSITNQLLKFSEAYTEEPKETPLNLLIENSVASAREGLESAGIRADLRLEEAVPAVSVIPNQMNMVFSNLIRLAITEMPKGGTLTVSMRRVDSTLCVEFTNSGARHASAEADELFLPSAVAKGLVPKGLGLYLVSNIIRAYGGDIKVSAGDAGGNAFSIYLPLKPADTRGEAPQ